MSGKRFHRQPAPKDPSFGERNHKRKLEWRMPQYGWQKQLHRPGSKACWCRLYYVICGCKTRSVYTDCMGNPRCPVCDKSLEELPIMGEKEKNSLEAVVPGTDPAMPALPPEWMFASRAWNIDQAMFNVIWACSHLDPLCETADQMGDTAASLIRDLLSVVDQLRGMRASLGGVSSPESEKAVKSAWDWRIQNASTECKAK